MTDYIGEVKLFAGPFAPRDWVFCDGSLLSVGGEYVALHSLIGTTYGGDGKKFALPDLRGRCVLGVGKGVGLTDQKLGQKHGSETGTLNTNQMPSHRHGATFTGGGAKLYTSSTPGTAKVPVEGDAISAEAGGTAFLYGAGDPDVQMDASSIRDVSGTVTTTDTGGNQPYSTMQPSIALNYIICFRGTYPSRK